MGYQSGDPHFSEGQLTGSSGNRTQFDSRLDFE
jgi:hypothetical protein